MITRRTAKEAHIGVGCGSWEGLTGISSWNWYQTNTNLDVSSSIPPCVLSLLSQRRSACSPETGQVSGDRGQQRSQTDEHINHTWTVRINLASIMTAAAASQSACSRAAFRFRSGLCVLAGCVPSSGQMRGVRRCVSAHRLQILNIMAAVSQPMGSSISLFCLAQKKKCVWWIRYQAGSAFQFTDHRQDDAWTHSLISSYCPSFSSLEHLHSENGLWLWQMQPSRREQGFGCGGDTTQKQAASGRWRLLPNTSGTQHQSVKLVRLVAPFSSTGDVCHNSQSNWFRCAPGLGSGVYLFLSSCVL